MKFLIQFILIALLAGLMQLWLPWWSCVVVAFIVAVIVGGRGGAAFLAGFLGIGMLWFGYAFWIDMSTESILTQRVAKLLFLPSSFLLIVVTAAIGGLMGGLGALSGNYLHQLRNPPRRRRKY